MKKLIPLLLIGCIAGFAVSAQTDRTPMTATTAARPHDHHHRGDKKAMMKQLNLSKEQQNQLKAQHKEMKAQREALKSQNLSADQLKAREKELRSAQRAKRDAVLTPEQRQKMADLRKQKQAQHGAPVVSPTR